MTQTPSTATVQPTLAYATPEQRASRLAPAVWITITGLFLIVFGGCFLIGVMFTLLGPNGSNPPLMTTPIALFLAVLYAAALGCFGGAIWLIVMGVRTMFAML